MSIDEQIRSAAEEQYKKDNQIERQLTALVRNKRKNPIFHFFDSFNRLRNKEQGFTMLEVIVSIATLALISGFILQMFILSGKLNDNARNLDTAVNVCSQSIEQLKAGVVQITDGNANFPTSISVISEGKAVYYFLFDENWNNLSGSKNVSDINDLPSSVVFVHKIEIAKTGQQDNEEVQGIVAGMVLTRSNSRGVLYTVTSTMQDRKRDKEIVSLITDVFVEVK